MRLHRPAVLVSAVAAAALVLAGCGSDASTATSSDTTPTADASAAASSPAAESSGAESSAGESSAAESSAAGESSAAESSAADESSAAESSAAAPAGDVVKPEKLTIALVPSSEADKAMGQSEPLTKYLTEKLGVPTQAVVTQDYTAAVEAIGANQAQAAFLPVLPMAQAVDRYQAQAALQVVRNGKTTYHTQFFTNNPDKYCTDKPAPAGDDGFLYCNGTGGKADGPAALDSVAKVDGATMAFVEQSSTSGYVFPMLAILNAGLTKDSVEPIFAGSHDNAVLAVYNGDAEVGVSFDDARTLVVKDKPDVGEKVVVFALSDEIPNDGIVTSKEVDPSFTKAFSDALIEFSKTEEGKTTLDALYEITDFAPADPASLEIVKQAAEKLDLGG